MACEKNRILGLAGYGWDSDKGTLCKTGSPTTGPVGTTAAATKVKVVANDWLNVKHDKTTKGDGAGGIYPPLPQFLKVEVYKTSGGREYFTILEGRLTGKTASVKLKSDGSSNLGSTLPSYSGAAKVKFNRKTKELWFGTVGPIPAFTQEKDHAGAPLNPIPLGIWTLELPYEVHDLGRSYLKYSKYATTWFHIITTPRDTYQDRFLHPGSVSLGCATVGTNRLAPGYVAGSASVTKSFENWTAIYNYLITSRANSKSVGTIEVVE